MDDDDAEAEDLRNISPEQWGQDIDWDDADIDDEDDDDSFLYEAINDDRQ